MDGEAASTAACHEHRDFDPPYTDVKVAAALSALRRLLGSAITL
jgi:hypothetical protein